MPFGIAAAAFGTLLLTAASAEHILGGIGGRSSRRVGLHHVPSVNFSNFMVRKTRAVRQATPHSHCYKSLPEIVDNDERIRVAASTVKTRKRNTSSRRRYNNSGFYYGIREDLMLPFNEHDQDSEAKTSPLHRKKQQQQRGGG